MSNLITEDEAYKLIGIVRRLVGKACVEPRNGTFEEHLEAIAKGLASTDPVRTIVDMEAAGSVVLLTEALMAGAPDPEMQQYAKASGRIAQLRVDAARHLFVIDEQTGELLGEKYHKGDNENRVLFYEQQFYVLSNFSAFKLHWRGYEFHTSEAAYHWEKFHGRGEGCFEAQRDIMLAPSAHEALQVARRAEKAGLRVPNWDEIKVDTMERILRAKVDQHEYVKRQLLATGDRELIEDSWRDSFWGWGADQQGQNQLGKLWMKIREDLRKA